MNRLEVSAILPMYVHMNSTGANYALTPGRRIVHSRQARITVLPALAGVAPGASSGTEWTRWVMGDGPRAMPGPRVMGHGPQAMRPALCWHAVALQRPSASPRTRDSTRAQVRMRAGRTAGSPASIQKPHELDTCAASLPHNCPLSDWSRRVRPDGTFSGWFRCVSSPQPSTQWRIRPDRASIPTNWTLVRRHCRVMSRHIGDR